MEGGDGEDESDEVSWPLFSEPLKVVFLNLLSEYVGNREQIYHSCFPLFFIKTGLEQMFFSVFFWNYESTFFQEEFGSFWVFFKMGSLQLI